MFRRGARARRCTDAVGAVALVACGSGAAGGNNWAAAHVVRGRVALAGLDGSTVSMYRVGEYGDPVATTTSSIGRTASRESLLTLEHLQARAPVNDFGRDDFREHYATHDHDAGR